MPSISIYLSNSARPTRHHRLLHERIRTATVLHAWQTGASLVPLQGGGWAPLPLDWLAQYGQQVADLLAAREVSGSAATQYDCLTWPGCATL